MSTTVKRWIGLALSVLLVFSAAAGTAETAPAADETRTVKISEAVAEGGGPALWELVNTRYSTDNLCQDGYAELFIWQPDGPSFPTQYEDDWPMLNNYSVNIQETAGTGFNLEQLIFYDVYASMRCIENNVTGDILPNGPVHIDPYGSFSFRYASPADGNARYSVAAAIGTDDNGHPLEFYGVMQQINFLPDSAVATPEYNTDNLRHDADFEVEVADGVWWVPARALGGSRYSNREIAAMVEQTPEEKQEKISTLYEAVQLFQISNFTYTLDNVDIWENKLKWTHCKPGYHSVRTNTGCCAADTSWLNYILSGDYEQLGVLSISVPDDDGHAINYIYHDGYYYFIDLVCYEAENIRATAVETGNMSDYRNSDPVSGSVHKVKNPEDFVKYYVDNAAHPPALFLMYESEYCLPSAIQTVKGLETIYFPEGYDVKVMEGKNPQKFDLQFVKGPEKTNPWKGLRDARYSVDPKYLGDGTASEPLTAYKPGDVLTLEDFTEDMTAVIDGTRYHILSKPEFGMCFESRLQLYGDYLYALRLPLGRYGEAMKEMDSLVLGELTLEIVRAVPETQIILCSAEGTKLTVLEVMDGKYYDTRKIVITKNEDGSWPETPEYWYLVVTRTDGVTESEFAIFKCGVSDET